MAIMDTVPAGYVFWDKSANKSYSAGQKFPTLGEGDYLVPATSANDGYYHQYDYHQKPHTAYDVTYSNCWYGRVQGTYVSRTDHKLPFNYLADKPVRWFDYSGCKFSSCPMKFNSGTSGTLESVDQLRAISFRECTNLVTAPNLPRNLTSLNYAFYKTKITAFPSNFANLNSIKTMYAAFAYSKITSHPDLSSKTTIENMDFAFAYCADLTSTNKLPPNVIDIGYLYKNCTNITNAPEIPSKVTRITQIFYGCTKLTGYIYIDSNNITVIGDTFQGTVKPIYLLHNPEKPEILTNTILQFSRYYNNVHAGGLIYIKSFTAVRGVYESGEFIERTSGDYCLLTCSFTSGGLQGAKLTYPNFTKDEVIDDTLDWHLNSLDGELITSTGVQLPEIGKVVSIIHIGTQTSNKFTISLPSNYDYTSTINIGWVSATMDVMLTYSDLIIDINPLGTGIAIGKESEKDGIEIDWDIHLNKNKDIYLDDNLLDIIVEESSSGNWEWRKWRSGKIEAWYYDNFSAETGTLWVSPFYYKDLQIDIPSYINFTKKPEHIVAVSASTQWWVFGAWMIEDPYAIRARLAKFVSSAQIGGIRIYIKGE